MLIRTSGAPQPNLYLLTLGNTCRYAVGLDRITLTDPGAPTHTQPLIERLGSLGLSPDSVERIVVTHLGADRVGGLPLLRTALPRARLTVTSAQASQLRSSDFRGKLHAETNSLHALVSGASPAPSLEQLSAALTPDEVVADSEVLECSGGLTMRLLPLPGHSEGSVGFLVEPYGFLIADEILGYYRGRELAAPGCDLSLEQSIATLRKLEHLPIRGLCLANHGILTGELVRKHINAVVLNTTDLEREVKNALASGIPGEVISRSIRDSFYLSESRDPFLLRRLEKTYRAILHQFGLTEGATPTAP